MSDGAASTTDQASIAPDPWMQQLSDDFRRRCKLSISRFESLLPSTRLITDMFETGEGMIDSRLASDISAAPLTGEDVDESDDEGPEEPDGDFEGDLEDEEEVKMTDEQFVDFLRGLNDEIVKRHNVPSLPVPADALFMPYDRQLKAAAVMRHAATSPFKGMILADNMGGGKTVSAILGMQDSLKSKGGVCVYVCPAPCALQVVAQIKGFFGSSLKVLLLRDRTMEPQDLFRYDIIVASYQYIAASWTSEIRFLKRMQSLRSKLEENEEKINKLSNDSTDTRKKLLSERKTLLAKQPARPRTALLTELFIQPGVRQLGPMLVLDEVQSIKNTHGVTHKAIAELRKQFETVIMMSGTPMDNTWRDASAYFALLSGFQISSHYHMNKRFTRFRAQQYDDRPAYSYHPKSKRDLDRLRQAMDAVTLRRPDVSSHLELETKIWYWETSKAELDRSNTYFQEYERLSSMPENEKDKAKAPGLGKKGQKMMGQASGSSMQGWKFLTLAQQCLSHPRLEDIYELVARAEQLRRQGEMETADAVVNPDDQADLDRFLDDMKKGENYRSAKVDMLLDWLRSLRDLYPDDAALLFDENVYFLDILKIGCAKQAFPIRCEVYSGRLDAFKRNELLERFSQESGFRVLLCTPGAAAVGLNLQWANHVIRTGPWWKRNLEAQALARALRDGQKKKVYEWVFSNRESKYEGKRSKTREDKHSIIEKVMSAVERLDSVQLKQGAIIRSIR